MAGMHDKRLDEILGYDDDYRSTEESRQMYAIVWYSMDARPGLIISLCESHLIVCRHPNVLNFQYESDLAYLVTKTLANMMRT